MRGAISTALVLALGCGDAGGGASAGGSGSGSGNGSSSGSAGESSSGSVDTSGVDFVIAPDGGVLTQCDPYADGCPAGEKCMPYASDGGLKQDATHCVPLAADPAGLDDACTVESWVASGIDDCDRGLFCVVYEPVELTGRCLAMCVADPEGEELACFDPNARCVGTPDTLPRLCATDCDPFGADCPEGYGCYRVNDHFVCLDDVSADGGDYGEGCLFTNQCNPGLLCADPPEFDGCDHPDGCCTPLCDTRDPEASAMCPGAPAHMCIALFDEGEGSPLFDWVGACVVPTPDGP